MVCKNVTIVTSEFTAANWINLYIPPIFIVVGSICNILVVMVMRSEYFCFVSTSFYMTVNAIVDTLSLLIALTAHWAYLNFPDIIDRGKDSHIACKFFQFFGWGTSDYGVIITAAMTTEKAIAIMFPLKASAWCTTKRAKRVMVVLSFVIIFKELHFLFTAVVVPEGHCEQLCDIDTTNETYAIFWYYVWPWVHNLFLLFSFITIAIGNAIILRHVKKSEYLQKSFTVSFSRQPSGRSIATSGGSRSSHLAPSRSRQLSILLLIDSFTVIVCTVPYSLFMTLSHNFTMFDNTAKQQGIKNLLFTISFNLLYLNRCANFYLYCISGTRFRQALRDVCCRKVRTQDTFVNSSSNSIISSAWRQSNPSLGTSIEIPTHSFSEPR